MRDVFCYGRVHKPMRPSLAVAVLAVLFPLAAAATTDVAISVNVPRFVKPDVPFEWTFTVENHGPHEARDVAVAARIQNTYCLEETVFESMPAGFRRTWVCSTTLRVFPFPDPYPLFAHVVNVYAFPKRLDQESNLENNNLPTDRLFVELVTDPDLFAQVLQSGALIPGLPFTADVYYGNAARIASPRATLTIRVPTRILKAPDNCKIDGGTAVCTLENVEPGTLPYGPAWKMFPIEVLAPDRSDERFTMTAEIHGDHGDPMPANNAQTRDSRTFTTFNVTNANDAGSGSLRAAMEAVNATCRSTGDDLWPCLIAFRIPDAKDKWQSIRLASPLPTLTAASTQIDATTQARYFTDTNPEGPEIELSGAALTAGHGFELESVCAASVRGFAINGFPWSAIHASGKVRQCAAYGVVRSIEQNYLGTDPTGMRAVPNTLGFSSDGGGYVVRDNVISGNRRSGVFLQRASFSSVVNNKIGVNRTVTGDLGNGASGVYLGRDAYGVDVIDNYIGFNRHAGVALDRGAQYNAMIGNSFQANYNLAIDRGIDGVDPQDNAPVITNVCVAGGKTIVEGTMSSEYWGTSVSVYANDVPDPSGYGEGQYYLGVTPRQNSGKFSFTWDGDLTGKWIAVTGTRHNYYGWLTMGEAPPVTGNGDWQAFTTTTTEFSRAVEVK
jgi:hypothetical protein